MMNIPYHNIVLFVCNKMTNSKHHTLNYIYIKFEDSKGIIRIRKSKERQHNGQKKKEKRTNNDLQNITQKTKDRAT